MTTSTMVTHGGKRVEIDGYCTTHARLFSFKEYRLGLCFWCTPTKAPADHSIRKLNPDELAKLTRLARTVE